jgi:hypothetical protein
MIQLSSLNCRGVWLIRLENKVSACVQWGYDDRDTTRRGGRGLGVAGPTRDIEQLCGLWRLGTKVNEKGISLFCSILNFKYG